jgi:hypothetical protein
MNTLVLGAPPVKVYVRVMDLVVSMGASRLMNKSYTGLIPCADAASLFESPAVARAAFELLEMGQSIRNYKIDPRFFAKYPELYTNDCGEVIAQGCPLTPVMSHILAHPNPLDETTMAVYRSHLDFTMNLYDRYERGVNEYLSRKQIS